MSLGFILLIVLILLLIGGVGPGFYAGLPGPTATALGHYGIGIVGVILIPYWGYGYGAGHYGVGGVGLILLILLVLVLTGRL